MSSKKTMLTATYDMKALKMLNDIDTDLKNDLCVILGVSDEDKLSDHVQNLDLQDFLPNDSDNVEKLVKIFLKGEDPSKEKDLRALAEKTAKKLDALA